MCKILFYKSICIYNLSFKNMFSRCYSLITIYIVYIWHQFNVIIHFWRTHKCYFCSWKIFSYLSNQWHRAYHITQFIKIYNHYFFRRLMILFSSKNFMVTLHQLDDSIFYIIIHYISPTIIIFLKDLT